MLTKERLKELLNYEPDTGVFTWRISRGRAMVNTEAGNLHHSGYTCIKIDGKSYRSHRLAFLWITGEFPPHDVDHRDGDVANNRWKNIRHATKSENMQNRGLNSNNKTGFPGVSYHKAAGKFMATIKVNSKNRYLGLFDTAETAYLAYSKAKVGHHEFQPEVRYLINPVETHPPA